MYFNQKRTQTNEYNDFTNFSKQRGSASALLLTIRLHKPSAFCRLHGRKINESLPRIVYDQEWFSSTTFLSPSKNIFQFFSESFNAF